MNVDDLRQMLVIAKYSFTVHVRSRRFYTLLGITGLLALATLLASWAFMDVSKTTALDLATTWVAILKFLTVLSALFFGPQAIAKEFQEKTGYFLLPTPVKREVIFMGKYIAALAVSLSVVLLYWVFAVVHMYTAFARVPPEVAMSVGLSLLYTASLLALTFFISSLFRSGTTAIAISAVLYFFVLNTVSFLLMLAGVEPWFMIDYVSGVINNVLMEPYPPHVVEQTAGGITLRLYYPRLDVSVAVMAAYIAVCLIAGALIFRRREMR
jgi:ABC-2 type transport system permease protein